MPEKLGTYMGENKVKTVSLVLGIFVMALTLLGYIPNPFEVGAAKVYEAKKPQMEKVLEEHIKVQALVQEPSFQRIEAIAEQNQSDLADVKQKLDNSIEIQKEILKEVKK